MRKTALLVSAGLALTVTAALTGATGVTGATEKIIYPPARQVEQVDTYHGVAVADPYRWLEAAPGDSPEVAAWVEAQHRLSESYLEAIPEREAIRRRLAQLSNVEARSEPFKSGGRYFSYHRDPDQERAVLLVQDSLLEAPRVLLDPRRWAADGSVQVTALEASRDGRYLVFSTTAGGMSWQTYRIVEIDSGRVLDDELRGIRTCCPAWTEDDRGFFYGAYPDPEKNPTQGLPLNHKIYYHRVGTSQAEDTVVYEQPGNPDWLFFPHVTDDGRYLVLTLSRGTGERFRILAQDLSSPGSGFRELVPHFDNRYMLYAGSRGTVFYFRTDAGAPNGRVIAIDLEKPGREHWREVIAESDIPLRFVSLVGNSFLGVYLEHGATRAKVFTLEGRFVRDVDLPGAGLATGFTGSPRDTETFYGFSNFSTPSEAYRYDLVSGRSERLWRTEIATFDPDRFEVRQVFYTSKDGTRVPLFLAHRKGLTLGGDNPTLLFGYGGFNSPVSVSFSSGVVAWLEMGGVYAAPGLRGGGEYGAAWHEAGVLLKKQNVFDDFIAAAEWLIANRYTRPGKLAIQGTSNGGLLVGAAMTQRPDLFGAVLCQFGVLDMLRYERFSQGRSFVHEYGSVEDPAQFKALHAYSPYHRLKEGTRYPATFVLTSENDAQVSPAHSFKLAARLQRAQAGDAPVLLYVRKRAGHGGGTKTQLIDGTADLWAFLVKNLGIKLPESFGKTVVP